MVVAIVTIVAAVAVPQYVGSSDQAKLDYASTQLVSALRYARQQAVKNGQPIAFVVSQGFYSVHSVTETSTTVSAADALIHPVSKSDYSVKLRHGIAYRSDDDAFVFDSVGGTNTLFFAADGQPHFKSSPSNFYRLNAVRLGLKLKNIESQISISALVGRVKRL